MTTTTHEPQTCQDCGTAWVSASDMCPTCDPNAEWRRFVKAGLVSRTVRDNVAFAWRNLGYPHPVLEQLPDDLVHDGMDALDAAGVAAMALVLPEVWAERGYVMLPCSEAAMGELDRGIPDSVFHTVWDEAGRRIDAEALVDAAGLTDEYRRGEG